ncbi:hypothetical protein LXM94_10315 [Rhizobium sp. TRM95111]|uniref:hypothetical protein n=1 Tax=Rhizobium alarense TaxID=2846851 RepID=UPI001F1CFB4B|nr:hypothetical protein [Rhizobium alarense]MCF3640358.1 hypothetical protein [Rhizobium alarense]
MLTALASGVKMSSNTAIQTLLSVKSVLSEGHFAQLVFLHARRRIWFSVRKIAELRVANTSLDEPFGSYSDGGDVFYGRRKSSDKKESSILTIMLAFLVTPRGNHGIRRCVPHRSPDRARSHLGVA